MNSHTDKDKHFSLLALVSEPGAKFACIPLQTVKMYNFSQISWTFLYFESQIRKFGKNFKGTIPTQLEFL